MKRLFVTILSILVLTGCRDSSLTIEGMLPNESYNNEWVYLVPVKGASASTVDSALINGNTFRINPSKHNLNKIAIVRVRPQLRLALQDIIVCVEPETVQIKLDSISHAWGTPLNDVLQNWKSRREKVGTDKSLDEYNVYVRQIVLENKNNEVGRFIYSLHKSLFTPEQARQFDISEE